MHHLTALYARVSTLQQEQEATIESQVAALETYAQEHGYQLQTDFFFLDQGVSGAKLARPALDRLRDLATEGAFSTVLCLSPDRLARQYAHQWVLLDELQRVGVQVIFSNQPDVSQDPQGQLFLGIQGLFAEYERAMITERLRRGKLYRIRQGQLLHPNPPYGYRYIPIGEVNGGRWVINEVEAEVVRQVYDWYTASEQLTLTKIVDQLRALGAAAPARGRQWTYSTVQAILTQPAYTGHSHYNRTVTCHDVVGQVRKWGRGQLQTPAHLPRPAEQWIEISVPALLEQAIWDAAQERLSLNQKFASRNNKRHFYLLRGLLTCDICGRTLAGRNSNGRVTYYCTNRGKNRHPDVEPHSCSISGELVEPRVWDAVTNLLRNPFLLADAWQSEVETENTPPDEISRLEARQRSLERQWTRLLDAFQDGLVDKTELVQRKARFDAEREVLTQRLYHLTRQNRREQAKTQMLDDFATFCQKKLSSLVDPTPEIQQEVIRLLIDHIVVEKEAITIKHIIPTDDDCRLLPGHRLTQISGIF
jgi:site-specific DNA recombinase